MHFPIIILEKLDTPVADWSIDVNQDDSTLVQWTDYVGELYTNEERRHAITSKWLQDVFEGIATVDTKNETITFLDTKTIQKTFQNEAIKVAENLVEAARKGEVTSTDFHFSTREWRGCWSLFCIDNLIYTAFELMSEAKWYAKATYKIGNILDAHW